MWASRSQAATELAPACSGLSRAWCAQPEPWRLSVLLTVGDSECSCHADMPGREVPALHCKASEQQRTVHLGPSRVSTPPLTDHRLGMPRSSLPLEVLSLCHNKIQLSSTLDSSTNPSLGRSQFSTLNLTVSHAWPFSTQQNLGEFPVSPWLTGSHSLRPRI